MTTLRNPSRTGIPDATPVAGRRRRSGFSLIEIMIVVGLLSVIILGLMGMFSQTQRAFQLGMSQTDVLESGRIATDLIVRELAQITPGNQLIAPSRNGRNFYVSDILQAIPYTPLLQPLPGGTAIRTNSLQDMFFLDRENQTWTGIGYCVRTNPGFASGWGPAGTLYRFEASEGKQIFESGPPLIQAFFASTTNMSRVLEGVVHFRVNTYDRDGRLLSPSWFTNTAGIVLQSSVVPGNVTALFRSNAVPAFVEVELGILEPQIYDRYRAISAAPAQAEFLKNQASRVHVFRQRVAVRNTDPSAYP